MYFDPLSYKKSHLWNFFDLLHSEHMHQVQMLKKNVIKELTYTYMVIFCLSAMKTSNTTCLLNFEYIVWTL